MFAQLIAEKLLEREIKQIEKEGTMEANQLLYSLCKKELLIIRKIKLTDTTGTIDEFNERIEKQAIYFMQPQEFGQMEEKARKYDEICRFINS